MKLKSSVIIFLFTFLIVTGIAVAGEWTSLGGSAERQSFIESFVADYSNETGYDSTGLITSARLVSEGSESGPLIKDDGLYMLSFSNIIAYNLTSASIMWNASVNGDTFSTPVIDNKAICYGEDDRLICRNLSSGALLWNYTENGIAFYISSPIFCNGKLWAGPSSANN